MALFAAKMSRTDSVATPALLTEKAAVTQPPNSIGIDSTGDAAMVTCVKMPLAKLV